MIKHDTELIGLCPSHQPPHSEFLSFRLRSVENLKMNKEGCKVKLLVCIKSKCLSHPSKQVDSGKTFPSDKKDYAKNQSKCQK